MQCISDVVHYFTAQPHPTHRQNKISITFNAKEITMLNLENVSFSYSHKTKLISDFSLFIEPGTVCGLLGANGSGKSTLLYLISGLLRPDAGHITVYGQTPHRRKTEFLQDVFIVPEEFNLPPVRLSDFIRINAPFYPRFDYRHLNKCLKLFDLTDDIHLAKLSMGQKKKVFLSFALSCHTSLLLLDEPTNGLDISSKRAFRQLVTETMDDSRIIMISTHQVYDIDKIIDHVVITSVEGVLLNAAISEITGRLKFSFTTDRDRVAGALISLPVNGGFSIIEPLGNQDEETEMNLESLYELARSGKFPTHK